MSISFYNEDVKKPSIDYSLLKRIVKEQILEANLRLGVLNFIFCSDDHLLSINKEFLQHDYYTDVITFDYTLKDVISGDVFISVDRVINNSEFYHENLDSELVRVIMHGLLHLLGYNDKTPEEVVVMRGKESFLIDKYLNLKSSQSV